MHLTLPALDNKDKFARWEFYLNTLLRIEPTFQRLKKNRKVLDAQWEGVFEIPPQNAYLVHGGSPEIEPADYDNNQIGFLNPQRWINAMMGGINTSDLPIKRKTITIPETGYVGTLPSTPTIEGNLLKIRPPNNAGLKALEGDVFKLGTPARMYEISFFLNNFWYCAPGILPLGDSPGLPQPATSIKFRLRGQPRIIENQTRQSYGGWTVPWEEAIE